MNNYDAINDLFDIANFIGKALHSIATGREFTEKDAKDAIDAISAVRKLGTDFIIDTKDESKEIRDFFNAISEIGKSGIDYVGNGGNNG